MIITFYLSLNMCRLVSNYLPGPLVDRLSGTNLTKDCYNPQTTTYTPLNTHSDSELVCLSILSYTFLS